MINIITIDNSFLIELPERYVRRGQRWLLTDEWRTRKFIGTIFT